MTFRELQDAVIADGFDESKRDDVQRWLNMRLAWLWNAEEWVFKQGTDDVTVTAASMAVSSVPTDFQVALGLLNSDGWPLKATPTVSEFYRLYLDAGRGLPQAYTVVDGTILVGPTSSVTDSAYKLIYEKAVTLLSADGDLPNIPDGYHMALVHGAKAEGFKLTNIPMWQSYDQQFLGAIDAMRRDYLVEIRNAGEQQAAYRP